MLLVVNFQLFLFILYNHYYTFLKICSSIQFPNKFFTSSVSNITSDKRAREKHGRKF